MDANEIGKSFDLEVLRGAFFVALMEADGERIASLSMMMLAAPWLQRSTALAQARNLVEVWKARRQWAEIALQEQPPRDLMHLATDVKRYAALSEQWPTRLEQALSALVKGQNTVISETTFLRVEKERKAGEAVWGKAEALHSALCKPTPE